MNENNKIQKIEKLPKYRDSVQSVYKELGNSFNKHATKTNLSRHVAKHDRCFVKDVIKVFVRQGLLRKHRSNTLSWTEEGLEYARSLLGDLPLKIAQRLLAVIWGEPHHTAFIFQRINTI